MAVESETMETFTNPISIKVGTLSKNAIKTEICHLFIHFNLYLSDKRTKKIFSMFSLSNLIIFVKNKRVEKSMSATHSNKVGACFLLITLCNGLGTENINCCFASGIFAHCWCIQDLSCSTVCGHHCLILFFMMRHKCSIGDRS